MPKIVDHDQYRKELLMKSFDLFAQKGYGSITMRQVAQGLGVSTGTLYHYFPSKEALFLQLVEEQTQQDILNFLTEAGNPVTVAERVETLFNFLGKNEDYFAKQTLLSIEFYQQDRIGFLQNQILKQADEQTLQAIANYMQITDKALIDFVMNLIYGLLLRRIFGDETVSFQEQSALFSKMLTAYLESEQK